MRNIKAITSLDEVKKKHILNALYKHDFWTTLISAFLASSISFAKLFSQAYILITLMPWIISLINLILSSVFLAVSLLNWENFFPTQLWKGTNARINTPPTNVALPILIWVSSTTPFPFHFYFLVNLHFNLVSSLLALFAARIAFQMKVKCYQFSCHCHITVHQKKAQSCFK